MSDGDDTYVRILAIEKLLLDLHADYFYRSETAEPEMVKWRKTLDKQLNRAAFPRLTPAESDHLADQLKNEVLRLADAVIARVRALRSKRSEID